MKSNWYVCAITLLPALFLPHLPIHFLSPLVVFFFYRLELNNLLWVSLGCGLLVDLLAGEGRLAVMGSIYCLSTALLHPQKRHFFVDHLSTLPILAALYTLLTTVAAYALLHPIRLTLRLVATDAIAVPLLTGVVTLITISLPLAFIQRGRPPSRYSMPRPK